MKKKCRCVLAVNDSEESKKAQDILKDLSVKVFVVRFRSSPNSFQLPFLITQEGRWQGLDEVRRFAEEIRLRRKRVKPLSGLDLMRLDRKRSLATQ